MNVQYTVLNNGLRVLSERVDHVETVSLGIWVVKGSRDEAEHESGMFHFIEHTLFKGTPTRSAREIAETIEGIGGMLDAYTGKEETCYTLRIRGRHLAFALEILADMMLRPLFDPDELDREREVVLEEIKMIEDNPEELAYEKGLAAYFQDHSLGRPILGAPENVMRFGHRETAAFHRKFYDNSHFLVAAAGKLSHRELCNHLEGLFPGRAAESNGRPDPQPPQARAFQTYHPHPAFEQTNFCLNFRGLSLKDPRRGAFALLSGLLGGGMSSRLFQKVREEHGLAYAIGSFTNEYSDCGHLTIYGGCSPRRFEQVMALCLDEIRRLKRNGVGEEEVRRAREQLSGTLFMGLEATQARAGALAKHMIYQREIFDAEREVRQLEQITPGQITELAREVFTDQSLGLYAVGKFKQTQPTQAWTLD